MVLQGESQVLGAELLTILIWNFFFGYLAPLILLLMRRPHSALLLIPWAIKLFDATIPTSLPAMPLFDATCKMDINSPPLTSPIQFAQSLKTYSTQDPASSVEERQWQQRSGDDYDGNEESGVVTMKAAAS